jgi:hypothetical protein
MDAALVLAPVSEHAGWIAGRTRAAGDDGLRASRIARDNDNHG